MLAAHKYEHTNVAWLHRTGHMMSAAGSVSSLSCGLPVFRDIVIICVHCSSYQTDCCVPHCKKFSSEKKQTAKKFQHLKFTVGKVHYESSIMN